MPLSLQKNELSRRKRLLSPRSSCLRKSLRLYHDLLFLSKNGLKWIFLTLTEKKKESKWYPLNSFFLMFSIVHLGVLFPAWGVIASLPRCEILKGYGRKMLHEDPLPDSSSFRTFPMFRPSNGKHEKLSFSPFSIIHTIDVSSRSASSLFGLCHTGPL